MPFTFSHPAIVLPLKYLPERFVSMTGLIIGSIVPDFEYFIRVDGISIYSHTLLGIFWFDLPLGIILTFVYHYQVRDTLIAYLPLLLKKRVSKFRYFDWGNYFRKNFPVVVICLVIGALSHILWDGFTHKRGYFTTHIPFLRYELFKTPVYWLLQHLSTLAGGIVIMYAIWKIPVDNNTQGRAIGKYWLFVLGVTIIPLFAKILVGYDNNYLNLIVASLTGILAGIILAPLFFKKDKTVRA